MVLLAGQLGKGPLQSEPFQWNDSDSRELGPEDALGKTRAVSAGEREALVALIEKKLTDNSDSRVSKEQVRQMSSETRILVTKLGGKSNVIAQAVGEDSGCSPTGNCPIWVFEKTPSGYRVILDAQAIQTFTIQHSRTNGYLDLVLGQHGSAFERELHVYRFQNGSYWEAACYDANWQRAVGDDVQELKKPDITPCQQQ